MRTSVGLVSKLPYHYCMPPFHHILFPVDFSEICHAFRSEVTAMAERLDARVTLLHVTEVYAGVDLGFPCHPTLRSINKETSLCLGRFPSPSFH